MEYKTSRKEAIEAKQTRYIGLPCVYGHGTLRYTANYDCVECRRIRKRAYKKSKSSGRPPGRPKSDNPKPRVQTPYSELSAEQKALKCQRAREYWLKHPDKKRAKNAKKRAKNSLRVPDWLTKQDWETIRTYYTEAVAKSHTTGFAWEVDHIIPLNGKEVSGLHVPNNLQVIPKSENASKSNKYQIDL